MITDIYNNQCDKTGELELPDSLFSVPYNEGLVHQIIVAYMAAARAGTKAQKNKSQVRGGGAKPWKQKGSGRARAGSSRSPLWRKGGVTFAAVPRSYEQKVNRKMYRASMRSIVSELIRTDKLKVFEEFSVESHKTKTLVDKLEQLKIHDVLILTEVDDKNLQLASRNLYDVEVTDVEHLNPLQLVSYSNVVMTSSAVNKLQERLA